MSTSMVPAVDSISFWRTVDVPVETYVAALDSWLRMRHGGELRFGGSQLLGPMEHDRDLGTRRIQVRLARGPLYPMLRMRLDIDRWSSSSTALELIPCRLVRPTADYFQAGHLLLDSLTRSLLERASPTYLRREPALTLSGDGLPRALVSHRQIGSAPLPASPLRPGCAPESSRVVQTRAMHR
jgi:hypothetical protein